MSVGVIVGVVETYTSILLLTSFLIDLLIELQKCWSMARRDENLNFTTQLRKWGILLFRI